MFAKSLRRFAVFDEKIVGIFFSISRHLKEDQKHLKNLIEGMDSNSGRKTKNIKGQLEEALKFLDTRERFWASQ